MTNIVLDHFNFELFFFIFVHFDQLMVLMSVKQLQEDRDFDNTKVMVNICLLTFLLIVSKP